MNVHSGTTASVTRRTSALTVFSWGVLVYNVLVILWGAFVRISGAGAGCGSHWPTCNGSVVPQSPTLHTVIEFSHRLTSGLSGLLAIALVAWVMLATRRGHAARLGAVLTLALIVLEGLVGGVQVLLGLTADSTDPLRGVVQGVHLVNTFALLGSLFLTCLWLSGMTPARLRGQGRTGWAVGIGLAAVLVLSMAGAVTALGDLLFRPEGTVGLGTVANDFSATTTVLQRLRVVHPVLAIGVSAYLLLLASWAGRARGSRDVSRWGQGLTLIIGAQMLAGFVNVALKAPGAMQITHLLLACIMWLVTIRFSYALLQAERAPALKEVTA
ncbi:COX15/CtaA family protein [Deinococcus pimensis]|uniref:COX15/CtaA family protein n=1 Tax=Deinococcus pimensis TaxID=309888 RepID=UPI0004B9B7A0|nr:COX15/CtaA family protein [Deinococcus pimensis]